MSKQTEPWSEMDFITVLAGAYPLYEGLSRLEVDPNLGRYFGRASHAENAAAHARLAAVTDANRREHALQAIGYLARLIELIDQEAGE